MKLNRCLQLILLFDGSNFTLVVINQKIQIFSLYKDYILNFGSGLVSTKQI
jgi:hypothetical protein